MDHLSKNAWLSSTVPVFLKIDPFINKNVTYFLKAYIDSAFFLCCSPFRLKLINGKGNSHQVFIAVSWFPQKIICFILTILHFFWLVRDIRISVPSHWQNPSQHFEMVYYISSTLWKVTALKYLWFDQKAFLDIVNFIIGHNTKIPVSNSFRFFGKTIPSKSFKIIAYVLAIMYSGVGISHFIAARGIMKTSATGASIEDAISSRMNDRSLESWWHINKLAAQFIFLMRDEPIKLSPVWESILGGLAVLGSIQRRIMPQLSYFFLLVVAITLRTTVRSFIMSFEKSLKVEKGRHSVENGDLFIINRGNANGTRNNDHVICMIQGEYDDNDGDAPKWISLRKQYKALKYLSDLINEKFGANVMSFIVQVVVFNAVAIDEVFVHKGNTNWNWHEVIMLGICLFNTTVIFLLSADICHQMESLNSWLAIEANRHQLPIDELHVIMHEVDMNVISIKANNIFPINYSILANIFGVAVTYFIICVQVVQS